MKVESQFWIQQSGLTEGLEISNQQWYHRSEKIQDWNPYNGWKKERYRQDEFLDLIYAWHVSTWNSIPCNWITSLYLLPSTANHIFFDLPFQMQNILAKDKDLLARLGYVPVDQFLAKTPQILKITWYKSH